MKTYNCRRATKVTLGIEDLEDLGELDILSNGRSILPLLWSSTAEWNQFKKVDANSSELAAIKFWLETIFFNQSYTTSRDGLTERKCEMLWNESDCFLEIQESSEEHSSTIIRIYRIDFDFDNGFHAILLSKVMINDVPFIVTRLETID
jgi:hypothetical protein